MTADAYRDEESYNWEPEVYFVPGGKRSDGGWCFDVGGRRYGPWSKDFAEKEGRRILLDVKPRRLLGWTRKPQVGDVLAPFMYPHLGGHDDLIFDCETIVVEARMGHGSGENERFSGEWEIKVQELRVHGIYDPDAPIISVGVGNRNLHGADRVFVVRRMKRTFL
jgi:hypothetical protein